MTGPHLVRLVCLRCGSWVEVPPGSTAWCRSQCGNQRLVVQAVPLGTPDPADRREYNRIRKLRKRRAYARAGVA